MGSARAGSICLGKAISPSPGAGRASGRGTEHGSIGRCPRRWAHRARRSALPDGRGRGSMTGVGRPITLQHTDMVKRKDDPTTTGRLGAADSRTNRRPRVIAGRIPARARPGAATKCKSSARKWRTAQAWHQGGLVAPLAGKPALRLGGGRNHRAPGLAGRTVQRVRDFIRAGEYAQIVEPLPQPNARCASALSAPREEIFRDLLLESVAVLSVGNSEHHAGRQERGGNSEREDSAPNALQSRKREVFGARAEWPRSLLKRA